MNTDDTFGVVFWTLVASMYSTRFWFAFRVWRTGERITAERGAQRREGVWTHAARGLIFVLLGVVVGHLWFGAGSLGDFSFPEPLWLGGGGGGAGGHGRGAFWGDARRVGAVVVAVPSDAAGSSADCRGAGVRASGTRCIRRSWGGRSALDW